jgi:hypothetical protein
MCWTLIPIRVLPAKDENDVVSGEIVAHRSDRRAESWPCSINNMTSISATAACNQKE